MENIIMIPNDFSYNKKRSINNAVYSVFLSFTLKPSPIDFISIVFEDLKNITQLYKCTFATKTCFVTYNYKPVFKKMKAEVKD